MGVFTNSVWWVARLSAVACVCLLPTVAAAQAPAPKVLIETSLGKFTVEMDPQGAPKTVANFLTYVREGYYNGLIFHRIVPGFVIQGGGYEPTGQTHQTHAPIALETKTSAHNARGTISMARTNDPNSANSQFFVSLEDNPELDPQPNDPGNMTGYTVFGRVIDGMNVVDAIASTPLGGPYGPDPRSAPQMPMVIQRMSIVN